MKLVHIIHCFYYCWRAKVRVDLGEKAKLDCLQSSTEQQCQAREDVPLPKNKSAPGGKRAKCGFSVGR